jgi:DNA-binding GntR family transcriptional regulator
MNIDPSVPVGSSSPALSNRGASSLKERAYVELKGRIVSGVYPPGTLLSERQLALSLKMSKTPVHAALERLEGDGLVSVAAQQGVVVCAMSPQAVADHYEIREALETFVAARLAGRLTSAQTSRLKRNLLDNRRAVRNGDVDENIRLDAEFHLLLCEFHGNEEIARAMERIRDKIHGIIQQISIRMPKRMKSSLAEHEAIVAALVASDGPTAAERMSIHLRNGLECIYNRHA